jgi:hypothetical protein
MPFTIRNLICRSYGFSVPLWTTFIIAQILPTHILLSITKFDNDIKRRNSMEHNPTWDINGRSADQEISCFLMGRKSSSIAAYSDDDQIHSENFRIEINSPFLQ